MGDAVTGNFMLRSKNFVYWLLQRSCSHANCDGSSWVWLGGRFLFESPLGWRGRRSSLHFDVLLFFFFSFFFSFLV
jgi:hypothetical protein